MSRSKEELYDLANDPHELHNLADHPGEADKLGTLRKEIDQWIADTLNPSKLNVVNSGLIDESRIAIVDW